MPKSSFAAHYATWIRNTTKHLSICEEVSAFLFTVWVDVLVYSAMHYGPHHIKTVSLEKTVTELIWASGARKTRRSRARTVKDTSLLMEKIREGMCLLGLPLEQQTTHLKSISKPMVDTFLSIDTRVSPVRLPWQDRPRQGLAPSHGMEHDHTGLPDAATALEVSEDKTDFAWSLFDHAIA